MNWRVVKSSVVPARDSPTKGLGTGKMGRCEALNVSVMKLVSSICGL